MPQRPELFIERAYNDAEAMAWSDKDMCFTSENYRRYFALLATIRRISAALQFQYVTPKNVFHAKDPGDQDLRDDLQRPRGQLPRYLFPTAPFAIGICPADEVVELICVADMSARTFWERATQRLQQAEGLVPLTMDYNDHLGRMALRGPQEFVMRFEISSSRPRGKANRCVIVLRYQHKPADFDNQITRERRITEAMAKQSPSLARVYDQQIWNQRNLDLWDALYNPKPPAGTLPNPDDAGPEQNEAPPPTVSPYLHHEFLRLHRLTRNLGLISPRLGLLSTEVLLQAWTVAMCIDVREVSNGGPSRSFQNCLWHMELILKDTPSGNSLCLIEGHEDFVVNMEGIDAASICLTDLMDQTNLANLNANGSSPASGLRHFALTYQLYIKIDANCWAARQRLRFADSFFDVLAALQQSIRTDTLGQTRARPWPYRLTRREEYGEGSSIYLIGLYTSSSGYIPVLPSHLRDGSLNAHVNTLFDIAFQNSDFDQTKCFIESELLTPETLIAFLESIDVVQSHIAPCKGLSDSLLPEDDFPLTTRAPMTASPMSTALAIGDFDPGNTYAVPNRPSNTSADVPGRFRPDASVISRLRFDPAHQDIEYEVGYQDRFLDDLVWKPLSDWQRATEEEDFVPSHRIRQIRRQRDGVVVWDREARFDMT